MNTPLINSVEVARRLGVSRKVVSAMTRAGRIKAIRLTKKTVQYDWREVCRALGMEAEGKGG